MRTPPERATREELAARFQELVETQAARLEPAEANGNGKSDGGHMQPESLSSAANA